MGNNRREFILGIAAIICVCTVVGDKFVATPLYELWTTRSTRIAGLEKNMQKGKMLVEREDMLKQRWDDMNMCVLPNNTSAAENRVFTSVDDLARESGLISPSQKPRWTEDTGSFRKVEFRISSQGNISSIAHFLYELEKNPMALRSEDISIVSRDEKGTNLTLDMRFTALTLMDETI